MCYERDHRSRDGSDALPTMRVGSLEVGVQAQTSNHRKRRGLRVFVVSVAGKGGAVLRQVRIEKTNASEPLMTCRKTPIDVETGIEILSREAGGGLPVYCSTGVRHEGGRKEWGVGSCFLYQRLFASRLKLKIKNQT